MWHPFEQLHVIENVNNDCENVSSDSEYPESENDSESSENHSPQKKTRLHLNIETQQICCNVYKNLRKKFHFEDKNSELIQATSDLTEIPLSTVRKIIENGPYERKKRSDKGLPRPIDAGLVKLLKTTIYDCYKRNEIPTIEIIRSKLESADRNINCCDTTLQNKIKKMGFKFRTINKREAIMESKRIVYLRNIYLNQVTKYRQENRPMVYLDETWYDTHDTVKKGWTDGSKKCMPIMPANRGTRLIIKHCGGNEGWVPNALKLCGKKMEDCNVDYHKNIEASIFEEWFEYTLIPNLEPNTVIVLDNASYHSRQLIKIPNKSSNKTEIQNFLLSNDLYFEDTYTKKQLLEVLNTKKLYALEKIAENHGHSILRLPPYFCIFNPIELIWGQLKQSISKFDKIVIGLIRQEVSNISKEDWQKRIKKVIRFEEEYMKTGQFHINGGNPFIIELSDDTDSEAENVEEGVLENLDQY